MDYKNAVIKHYKTNWGKDYKIRQWDNGPMRGFDPQFCVLEFAPHAERKFWTYATCGMSKFEDLNPIELHLFSEAANPSLVELLTVIAYYHKIDSPLNLNHTVNFGRSWLPRSECSYGLISLPYLDGPNLEILQLDEMKQAKFYWLLPISQKELEFKKQHGVEKLEEKFDNENFNYLDPLRKSVV